MPNPPTPIDSIVFTPPEAGKPPPPPDTKYRAVHQIRLSSISHNYTCVESAAAKQRCSVIVVVKADGYGHGAIESAVHLADHVGADAFAVATLEEGIALRKAFETTPPSHVRSLSGVGANSDTKSTSSSTNSPMPPQRSMRSPQIRILVLGPPVGYPRCFDEYFHHGIEVMCSGPEVAKGMMEWVSDEKARKRTQVERAANDAKQAALSGNPSANREAVVVNNVVAQKKVGGEGSSAGTDETKESSGAEATLPALVPEIIKPPSATLGNVSGQDLAKEVRQFLMNQQAAKDKLQEQQKQQNGDASTVAQANKAANKTEAAAAAPNKPQQVFGGIEAVAKNSRTREAAAARAQGIFREDSNASDNANSAPNSQRGTMPISRKRLRYHILVDSGMGRLGFKTQPVEVSDVGVRRDTVEIINELVEMEVAGHPVEFFGMCTHMADANSTSTYTNDQMNRFKGLLKRVRGANVSIPTVSTDNSAALLTTSLKHFDAKALLSQPHAETRGYVRTGGAIYGQRPTFTQLKAVSTLLASVRHVAVLKEGESVGYDRAYIATQSVRIATLTIGFADGYPRDLGNGIGKVAIRGHLFPVAGNVCMDMMMVELGPAGDKTGPGAQVVVGDTAVLWGPLDENDGDGLVRLQDIAKTLKTTQSVLTCGINKIRVERQYV